MKCPNCHCEISSNERICRYCGFDIEQSRRDTLLWDDTMYYRNAMQYYEENFRREKEKKERYREVTIIVLVCLVAVLNLLEIFLVLWH